jgi:hypothetical protein
MKKKLFTIVVLFIVALIFICSANAGQQLRSYHPLEAKLITIGPVVKAIAPLKQGEKVEGLLSKAWKEFDRRNWAEAKDSFLAALNADPRNQLAGEGLAISVYRSGDYKGAFKVASELKASIPSAQELVSEIVVADVQSMIRAGDFLAASEFLNNFPSLDSGYGRAHELFGGAYGLSKRLKVEGMGYPVLR